MWDTLGVGPVYVCGGVATHRPPQTRTNLRMSVRRVNRIWRTGIPTGSTTCELGTTTFSQSRNTSEINPPTSEIAFLWRSSRQRQLSNWTRQRRDAASCCGMVGVSFMAAFAQVDHIFIHRPGIRAPDQWTKALTAANASSTRTSQKKP